MTTLWKLGGAVCNEPAVLDALARTLTVGDASASSGKDAGRAAQPMQAGPRHVIMHGAGPQLDAALREVDGEPRKIAGLRVTSPAGADVVCRIMDEVGAQLTQLLQQRGVPTRHVPAASRWLTGAQKLVVGGSLGRVGTPMDVVLDVIHAGASAMPAAPVLAPARVPVLSPVAWDHAGPLNVNADEAAAAAAAGLHCDTLHLVTDVANVRRGNDALTRIDVATARQLIADGHAQGGMIPKLEAACAAIDAGVVRVGIGDLASLLAGGGTWVTA